MNLRLFIMNTAEYKKMSYAETLEVEEIFKRIDDVELMNDCLKRENKTLKETVKHLLQVV